MRPSLAILRTGRTAKTREPLCFSSRHWWNVATATLAAAGIGLWRAYGVDGRLVIGILLAWALGGWLVAPSILYEHLGFLDRHVFHDYTKSMSRYRKAVDTKTATVDGICALASLCYSEGDDSEAAALLEDAVRRRPRDPHVKVLLARVLTRLGRYGEALAVAAELHSSSGQQLGPITELAIADVLKAKGDAEAAASAYQRAAGAAPRMPAPRLGLAEVYLRMGKIDAAHVEAHEALAKAPANPDALYWAGKAVEARGYRTAAGEFYRAALESRPVGDHSLSVTYKDIVRALTSTSGTGPPSPGKDVR